MDSQCSFYCGMLMTLSIIVESRWRNILLVVAIKRAPPRLPGSNHRSYGEKNLSGISRGSQTARHEWTNCSYETNVIPEGFLFEYRARKRAQGSPCLCNRDYAAAYVEIERQVGPSISLLLYECE